MKRRLIVVVVFAALMVASQTAFAGKTVWIDELSLGGMDLGVAGYAPMPRASAAGKIEPGVPLKVGDRVFVRGVGTHAPADATYEFAGEAVAFEASVGVDAWVGKKTAEWKVKDDAKIRFRVVADGKTVAESPEMVSATPAFELKADLHGAKVVRLEVDDCGSASWDYAVWGDARFTLADGATVTPWVGDDEQLGILTPKPGPAPRIVGAKVFGVRPGHEILWRMSVTGERPMAFAAADLPVGVAFDAKTGALSGKIAKPGTYSIALSAKNAKGEATSTLKLVVGEKLALTPPMGWNSWNAFGPSVKAEDIRAAADAFVALGLVDHGWSYINIDDYWQNSVVKTDEKTLQGPLRTADGTVVSNVKFPSMKDLADYIHAKGLKAGIYSSPAAKTCGGCEASWGHEWKDAATYAAWGYDYLKYDGCSYAKVAVGEGYIRGALPFRIMAEALRAQDRDIVLSVNPYDASSYQTITCGGESVGVQCWRTTSDINDSWRRVYGILTAQRHRWPYARPGAWNDPDMLVVGVLGGPWGARRPSSLTQNAQYTHMSLWCILCSPLLIGCDLTAVDDFTLSLLTNDEVLETNQDELGAQAEIVLAGPRAEVWAKPMRDGSYVLALVNTVRKTTTVTADLVALGLEGKWRVRDLWRQRDVGLFGASYSADVPPLATQLVRLFPEPGAGLRKGLTDIRMNGFYRLLEEKRPVGRPGYQPPKDWPCKDCPRTGRL